jgi:hypothetical protein
VRADKPRKMKRLADLISLSKTRPAKNLAAGIAMTLLLALYLYGNQVSQRRREQWRNLNRFYADVTRIRAVLEAARSIYQQSGRLIGSLAELERTDYYPFPQPYARSFYGGAIDVTLSESTANEWRGEGAVLSGSQVMIDIGGHFERVGPQRETQRMVTAYCAGVAQRRATIEAIENQIMTGHLKAVRSYQDQMHHAPNVTFHERDWRPRPLAADWPKNDRELKRYVAWLRATEGVTELKDAWSCPLKFTLTPHGMTCRSAGADGDPGTADDVVGISPHDQSR